MKNSVEVLTPDKVRDAAFPVAGDYTLRDSKLPGLGLRVSPGSKTWLVRRKLNGKSFRHVLGHYPEMLLDAARREARKAVGTFQDGRHPTLERQARQRATTEEWLATRFTVQEMWREYRDQDRGSRPFSANSVRDFDRLERGLQGDPIWSLPLWALTSAEILRSFRGVTDAATENKRATNGGKTSANLYFRLLRSAAAHAINLKKHPPGENVFAVALENNWHRGNARTRTLTPDKTALKRWWDAVEKLRQTSTSDDKRRRSAAILADYQFLLLLWGGRRKETLRLKWTEVDFDMQIVRFPAAGTKTRIEHAFPLAPYAEMILRRLSALQTSWGIVSDYVFASNRTGKTTKTKTYIQEPKAALKAVSITAKVPFTTHDIRRTFTNMLGASGVGAELPKVKMALNHKTGDVTTLHYLDKVATLRPLYEQMEQIVLERVGVITPKMIEVDAESFKRFQEFEASQL